jgi:hypothetical protein
MLLYFYFQREGIRFLAECVLQQVECVTTALFHSSLVYILLQSATLLARVPSWQVSFFLSGFDALRETR